MLQNFSNGSFYALFLYFLALVQNAYHPFDKIALSVYISCLNQNPLICLCSKSELSFCA